MVSFSTGQYNLLAGYLGNNVEPWFLYGVDVNDERRAAINALHQERGPDGRPVNAGWPNYVKGVLSPEEQAKVERVDAECFSWEQRQHRIVKVIEGMASDVLSLVECDHYEDFFKPQLDTLGYESIWVKRPRDASLDGCCIAWKCSKFELVSQSSVEYSDQFDELGNQQGQKDRVALLALLRVSSSGDLVCIVSTHLTRNPEQEALDRLRCRQVGQVIRHLGEFVTEQDARGAPIVLLGDMNATSFRRLLGMSIAATLLRTDPTFIHPFIFESKEVETGPTSVTAVRTVCIDAILYQKSCLELQSVGEMPVLTPADPIPNREHPSDHVPVTSNFRILSKREVAEYLAREWYLEVAHNRDSSLPLSPQQLAVAFSFYDRDGNGQITAGELKKTVLAIVGELELEGATPENVLQGLPQQGTFGFDVFVDVYVKSVTEGATMPGLDNLEDAFHAFDLDGNGVLSAGEVQKVFKDCCPTEPPDEKSVQQIFRVMDDSKDGSVQLPEFLAYLNKAWQTKLKDECAIYLATEPQDTIAKHIAQSTAISISEARSYAQVFVDAGFKSVGELPRAREDFDTSIGIHIPKVIHRRYLKSLLDDIEAP